MTTFYLIRHGNTDAVGKVLVGRMPGIHLNLEGQEQAARLAERFRHVSIDAIYGSPLERALETAEPLSKALGIPVQIAEEIIEVEYGEWTGRAVSDVLEAPIWHDYISFRTRTAIPGSETVLEIQTRFVAWMEAIRRERPDGRIAVVSHADPIKAVIAYYIGLHLDMFPRFEISPASVSILQIDEAGPCVVSLNSRSD